MKLDLPSSICSQQDLQSLLLEIHAYREWYIHNNIKKRLHVKGTSEQPLISTVATELVREWSIKKPLSQSSLDELIHALEVFRDTAPSVTITLAAPASLGLKRTLVEWCRKNITTDLLVNFEFNATLLGGMVVRFGSHIIDCSFRQQILDARTRFPEVLRRV